jgi:hypothetical protein
MPWLAEVLSFFAAYGTPVAAVGAGVAFVWSVWQFFDVRRRESRNKDFKTYHRLIKELVEPPAPGAALFLDRQIAVVFELRHFKRYREVSVRILKGLKKSWEPNGPSADRLITEIDLTISHLE